MAEKFIDFVLTIAALAVGVPFVLICFCWAVNVVHIMSLIGDKVERFIGEKIDKKLYDKHVRLRKEIDGD